MSINNAKHIVGEIDGVRCTIIESGIDPERAAFLTDLLEFNHFEVKKMVIPPGKEGEGTEIHNWCHRSCFQSGICNL